MTLATRIIASGAGWQASEVRCCAGPGDPAFEEQHERVCMAVVLEGTFNYRSPRGAATLAPGAILLGNPGECFECGHEHSVGDRCLALHFDPAFHEAILAGVPGATRLKLQRPALPPQMAGPQWLPVADAVLDGAAAAEEFACELVAGVAMSTIDTRRRATVPRRQTSRIQGRIQELAHWIERESSQPLSLAALARHACMSPYHLLREFKRIVGITPHQFLLSLRLRRAAHRLRDSPDPVLQIALDSGFSDLSEFNRRFRRVLGVTPRVYRARKGGRQENRALGTCTY